VLEEITGPLFEISTNVVDLDLELRFRWPPSNATYIASGEVRATS
jgi:hypothetical protein